MSWLNSKPKPKLEGNYKYYLHLSHAEIDSSTTLSITAFTNQEKHAVVPCHYNWFILKNGVPQ